MPEFEVAMPAAELPPGQCAERIVGGRPVALFNVDGRVFATSNLCLHRGGPLGQGMLAGHEVMCPWHAWTWDVRSGENTANRTLKMETFEVKVENGNILVRVP
jgi:nitrite reductase/ring-hydroxylating ferredoxin subunit